MHLPLTLTYIVFKHSCTYENTFVRLTRENLKTLLNLVPTTDPLKNNKHYLTISHAYIHNHTHTYIFCTM